MWKIVNVFLPISLIICFGCSKEPSHWDGSFEYQQHILWLRNKKNTFSVPNLNFIDFHRVQCNEPYPLALDFNETCSSNSLSYRFKSRSHTGWSSVRLLIRKCKILFLQKSAFSNCDYCVQNFSYQFYKQVLQPNIERLKMCSSDTFHVSDIILK